MVVRHIVACVGCSRSVVGPCFACSLLSGVALAPEILYFSPLSIVTKQEPQRIFLALFDVFLTSRFVNLLQLKMEEDVL